MAVAAEWNHTRLQLLHGTQQEEEDGDVLDSVGVRAHHALEALQRGKASGASVSSRSAVQAHDKQPAVRPLGLIRQPAPHTATLKVRGGVT
jgi:hypothetical protein